MNRAAAEAALKTLALRFEASWRSARKSAFAGAVTFETENTSYRFVQGVFVGRAPRKRTGFPVWEVPDFLQGTELLGFLYVEKGLWSLAQEWREGSLAVITTASRALTLTSPTIDFDQHEPTIPTVRSFSDPDAPVRRSA